MIPSPSWPTVRIRTSRLKGLALTILRHPIADINEVYAELDRFDRTEQRYIEIAKAESDERYLGEVGQILDMAFWKPLSSVPPTEPPPQPPSLAPTTALALSLATGIELWWQEKQRGDGDLLLAITVATPESMDTEAVRLTFTEPRAVLALRPGSLTALLYIGCKVVQAVGWVVSQVVGIAGRVRAAEAAARAFVENLRQQRKGPGVCPLIRLDCPKPLEFPPNPKGVVLFLHGLMSTDLGTFDGLIRRWLNPKPSILPPALFAKNPALQVLTNELELPAKKAIEESVALVGWPHDTLTSIDQNAHKLARLIDERLGQLPCKIAFVCHSRGGFVARATAVKLYEHDKSWEDRICLCITFGTPHAGVAWAEHPDRRLGAYVLSGLARKELASFIDMSAYLRQREHIEGIEDLRPPSAPKSRSCVGWRIWNGKT